MSNEIKLDARNNQSTSNVQESRRTFLGREIGVKKVCGWAAVIAGILLIAAAAVFASGVFGGGYKYMVAGGGAIASVIPFSIAALLLVDSEIRDPKLVPFVK